MFLLDPNICIYAIQQKPVSVIEKLFEHTHENIYISSLTIAEIEFGISSSLYPDRNRMAFTEFLTLFEILDVTAADAIQYGTLRALLKREGKPIGPIDTLLAEQALHHNLIMVTNNEQEFLRVPHLMVEHWTA